MTTHTEINLMGVLPPVCLLQCKKHLNDMAIGDVICVCVQDQETVRDLSLIIARSNDRIIKQERNAGTYRVFIQKG